MKKILVVAFAGMALMGCGDPAERARNHELAKLEMQQKHELEMARLKAGVVTTIPAQQQEVIQYAPANSGNVEGSVDQYSGVPSGGADYPADDSGGSLLSTVGLLAGGAIAGYAVSELLDDGYRTYTDGNGRSVYVDKSGRQISQADYDAYKKKHPTKHSISQYNQKGKAVVNTAKEKTVAGAQVAKEKTTQAASAVKDKTVETAEKVDQKVVQPAKKKYTFFKKSGKKGK